MPTGVSRICITAGLMIVVLSFSVHARGEGHPTPPIPPSLPTVPMVAVDPTANPLCRLVPPITMVDKQENSAWCWAASTHMVIKYLEPLRDLTQCQVVYNTLASGRNDVDCCLV